MMVSLLPRPWSRPTFARAGDAFTTLQREVDRLFDEFTHGSFLVPARESEIAITPRVDVSETDNALEVEVELPGVDEKDVEVTLNDNVLIIKGERKHEREEKKKDFHLVERSFGSFARSISLPFEVDTNAVKASFSKGVLKVTLPKPAAAKAKTRRIEIKGAE
jgi:HSP20 family protein